MTGSSPIVETRALGRDFAVGPVVVHACATWTSASARGSWSPFEGGRGRAGKTTLLSLIGGLDRATTGDVILDGQSVGDMSPDALVELRRRKIGFIFQAFGLLSILSAAENVEVPLRLVRAAPGEREERVATLLELVGLGKRGRHRPHELSGGPQQRVAIAGPWPTGWISCSRTSRPVSSTRRPAARS